MAGLVKQLQEQTGFSESECMIADYLLKNFRMLAGRSTRQLAKDTYTNSAAIVRFSQKLGFGGYTEFKVQFLAEMLQYVNRPHGAELLMTDRDSVHSILDKVTSIEIDALKDTRSMLDPGEFMRALHLLSKTEHVDFYAMDNNLDIANMAASSFIMANKCSTVHAAMTMQYLQATGAPKEHVAFFISRTGENRMLLDIAKTAQAAGQSHPVDYGFTGVDAGFAGGQRVPCRHGKAYGGTGTARVSAGSEVRDGYSFCLIDDAGRLSQYAAERRMAQPTFSLLNKIML